MSSQSIAPAENVLLPRLRPQEFEQIRRLAYREFGLELPLGKEALVTARLGKLLRELRLRSYQQYYDHLMGDRTGGALIGMIDALTTNHTNFFREPAHFQFLASKILPTLRRANRISIWSAACSSGEEPYTISFALREVLDSQEMAKVRILATDISTRVLDIARAGQYLQSRIEPAVLPRVRPHLERMGIGDSLLVKKELRNLIEFRRMNLIKSISNAGAFPVIFCRNVMIYFDRQTQQDLVERLWNCLEPGGYLMIGHAESLSRIKHGFSYIQPAVYQRPVNGVSTGLLDKL